MLPCSHVTIVRTYTQGGTYIVPGYNKMLEVYKEVCTRIRALSLSLSLANDW